MAQDDGKRLDNSQDRR